MTERTITRADLADALYKHLGLSRSESADLVELVLNSVTDEIVKGNTVKLSGFGAFEVRQKGERVGRNPKTGVEVPITPRKVLTFRASHLLKEKMNKSS